MKTRKRFINVCILLFFIWGLFRLGTAILPLLSGYVAPFYDDKYYRLLEDAFNHSQYRMKNNTALIPDETVYSYAAGAYLRGIDPILINSERTPLGKYFLAISIFFFKNDKLIILPFGLLTLVSLWLLSFEVLKNKILATMPVTLLIFEQLFINQFKYVPLLDLIHLPFILLSLYFFIRERRSHYFWFTWIMIGLTMATKTVYSGLLLIGTFEIYFALTRRFRDMLAFFAGLIVPFGILVLSYLRTFQDGYTFIDFLHFQKWILLYDQSKIIYPFSIWRLVFLNQWQAWWGDMRILKADDWQMSWPIFTGLSILLMIAGLAKKISISNEALVMSIWFLVYGLFISAGIASSRFLFPILPAAYILSIYFIKNFLPRRFQI